MYNQLRIQFITNIVRAFGKQEKHKWSDHVNNLLVVIEGGSETKGYKIVKKGIMT